MQYQWYPGHMTKALRELEKNVKLIDLFVEIVDARMPAASTNPDLNRLLKEKKKVVVLNKADLADPAVTAAWISYLRGKDIAAVSCTATNSSDMKRVRDLLFEGAAAKRERDAARGMKPRPFRAVVSGIPNVGKSTIINSLKGKAASKTGNKPGVTKGEQWIRIGADFDLLDTPGLLWPKFEDKRTGILLSLFGSINDEVFDMDDLAAETAKELVSVYPGLLNEKYGLDESGEGWEIVSEFALKRNFLVKGGEPDYARGARAFVNEIRSGKAGRITLEKPQLVG